ncbi:MAG TPA: DUF4258 domain-containing protein [Methanosarcinales archaeon]|nr:DUF4258 domain-containing protein [Methanosarcinales archaeon]
MKVLFEEHSILCKIIRTNASYWKYVVEVKHPESFKRIGFQNSVELTKETLRNPDMVVRERIDPSVYLYYRHYRDKYFICVVAKPLNGDGYIITAYLTDHIKRGEVVYGKD